MPPQDQPCRLKTRELLQLTHPVHQIISDPTLACPTHPSATPLRPHSQVPTAHPHRPQSTLNAESPLHLPTYYHLHISLTLILSSPHFSPSQFSSRHLFPVFSFPVFISHLPFTATAQAHPHHVCIHGSCSAPSPQRTPVPQPATWKLQSALSAVMHWVHMHACLN